MGVIMQVDERHKEIIAKKWKYLIGIDEAGRGALAGPVAVGLVMWKVDNWPDIKKFLKAYPEGRDSKKLTLKQRDFWFAKIEELEKLGLMGKRVALISSKVIDQKGINFAIKQGIEKCLGEVASGYARNHFSQADSLVLLDGGLKAPVEWENQQTIIKGDEKELVISLASIVVKVTRDREMIKLTKKYPDHCLEKHKGYGTKLHYQKIEEFGVLVIHRETYLAKLG